jgi:hypothetical protein
VRAGDAEKFLSCARPTLPVDASNQESAMPHVIAVGSRSNASGWWARLLEPLAARLGWLTGRVPSGVTPTLTTWRLWR